MGWRMAWPWGGGVSSRGNGSVRGSGTSGGLRFGTYHFGKGPSFNTSEKHGKQNLSRIWAHNRFHGLGKPKFTLHSPDVW